ncbi:MAG: penicillin acylase family protein [Pseudomonadota bacterium]
MRTLIIATLALALGACAGDGGGGKQGEDTTAPADILAGDTALDAVTPDVVTPDVDDDTPEPPADTVVEDTVEPTLCLGEVEAAAHNVYTFGGVDGPIEIVVDQWGIPHVYATTEADMFRGEGFIVAKNRIISMHAMRRIASGTWGASPAADAGDLSNDVYMRVVGLRRAAEMIWAKTQAEEPEVAAMLEAFSAGVNAYLDAANGGKLNPPLEWYVVGVVEPWTPVDCLTIGRLQSWDLSFEGQDDKINIMARYEELTEKYAETPLAGLFLDLHPLAPTTDALTMPPSARERLGSGAGFHPERILHDPFLRSLPAGYFAGVNAALHQVPMHHDAASPRDVGSNNWIVSGDLTATGGALVVNDTHLSLRNPAVFMEVHLNTTRAGGDLDLAGVCFPGIPGIILGRNGHAAWGATVYYADVTDVYVETYTPGEPATVAFDDGQVPVEIRQEVFSYKVPEDGCASWVDDFIGGLDHTVAEVDGMCELTVDIEVVPHHGPIIPGTRAENGDGGMMALTWKWTGMEPSDDIKAVYGLMKMKSPEDFLAALESFGVGAQNWVYGDVDGRIAYSAYVRIPIREHLASPPVEHPTFLPMPGDGCCEWVGDVPLDAMPHVVDPPEGFVISANGDAWGYLLDGDPFNDPSYQGFMFETGYREGRLQELMGEALDGDAPLDVAVMQAMQADHLSPQGIRLTPHILAAVAAAEADDGALAALLTPAVLEARDRLDGWSFLAAHGVGEDATAQEKADAVATAIFNAWVVHLVDRVVESRMDTAYNDQFAGRFLLNLFDHPDLLLTWNPDTQDSLLWDDPATEVVVEDRNTTILLALRDALDFLSDPANADVLAGGGFGTDDQDQWLWGRLHGLTLGSAIGGDADIPPPSKWPEGYPRPGDMFCVDAAHPGMSDTDFHFSSGAAIRNVFDMDPAGIKVHAVIPGGEDAAAFVPHYADLFYLWAENETAPIHGEVADVIGAAESCVLLTP